MPDAECFTNAQVFSPTRCSASSSPKVAALLHQSLYTVKRLCKASGSDCVNTFLTSQVFSPTRCAASAAPKVAVGLSALTGFSREAILRTPEGL